VNCDCINEIDKKLREQNVKLCGYAFTFPSFKTIVTIDTEWVDPNKAPKGKKRSCPKIFASHCPFCGKEIEKETEDAK